MFGRSGLSDSLYASSVMTLPVNFNSLHNCLETLRWSYVPCISLTVERKTSGPRRLLCKIILDNKENVVSIPYMDTLYINNLIIDFLCTATGIGKEGPIEFLKTKL
jgi:hypothetical protein